MRQVYDETTYIDSSISLVTQNLFIGGAIAGVVLMVFLRSFISTGIVAIAIPVSVIGTFLVLLALGRTLNVISLAGLAFAVGMVVDNAIVVLENIYRRIQQGDEPMKAALRGGREVWGAILASTLTTAAVFIPVLTIQEEAGQLFRDIALAIVASVVLSLIVSITVIPAASSRWMKNRKARPDGSARTSRIDAFFGKFVTGFANWIHWCMGGWRGWTVRPLVILGLTAASLGSGAGLLHRVHVEPHEQLLLREPERLVVLSIFTLLFIHLLLLTSMDVHGGIGSSAGDEGVGGGHPASNSSQHDGSRHDCAATPANVKRSS